MNKGHRGITLRQVTEDDMHFLFRLFAEPERCHLWMRCRQVFDEREFYGVWAAWTANMIGGKFIVESVGKPVGLAFDYDRTVEDGWTKVTVLLDDVCVGGGGGVIATVLITDWLFRTLPLRKIYHEVYDYNSTVIGMWRKLGVVEEGCFKADRFYDGRYWDLNVFAVYRQEWPRIRGRVLRSPHRTRQPEQDPVVTATERGIVPLAVSTNCLPPVGTSNS